MSMRRFAVVSALAALALWLAPVLPAAAETARDGSWSDQRPPAAQDRQPSDIEEDGVHRETRPPEQDRAGDPADASDPSDPVRVTDPRRDVVIIFNHGTRRPQVRHRCDRERDIPDVLRGLARKTGWRVHYLCSKAIDGGKQGSYTYKRAAEIRRVVEAYRAAGLPASRLFLAGHSAGGWSSLIAARRFGDRFNAVIAFAPAFAGPRHEVAQYPWWRNEIRPRQVADILKAARLRALVFAFPDDSFNRPRELVFLKRLREVELVPFVDCRRGHGTTYSDCFRGGAAARIERYIRTRLSDTS